MIVLVGIDITPSGHISACLDVGRVATRSLVLTRGCSFLLNSKPVQDGYDQHNSDTAKEPLFVLENPFHDRHLYLDYKK